ncbi:Fur family transcriptional regulator [Rhodohalobacter barkolensis]|uniref:Transcriptional repressor n=1 Tax=Rhodohalobacter barkolensis TaxID=2053187 RepID=A0A2N0VJT0_9BACT|nr:transcriptional repressor [Rhodohalobacter barkolensis]PKD44440.1 transcriptional repressor [Rhodohalobacter barkolensis]
MEEKILINQLQNRKIQPTSMRLMVLNFLVKNEAAVSLTLLENHFTRSDRTTLYRTLRTFEEKGLVHRIDDAGDSTKYALCPAECTCSYPDDTHLHFFCTDCEKTFCFRDLNIPNFSLPEQFIPKKGNFVISGFCPSCAA